jgi:hypothetical protein
MLLDDPAGHPMHCRVLTSLAPDQAKKVARGVLANFGWSHVSEEVVEGFAAANGIDLVSLDDKIRSCDSYTEVVRRATISLSSLPLGKRGALPRKRSVPPKKPSVFRRSASIIDKIKGKRSFVGQRKSGHA